MTPAAHRHPDNPILTPQDVQPIMPGWEVLCAFNPAVTEHAGDVVLLLRVAERPSRVEPRAGEFEIDLREEIPQLIPIDRSLSPDRYIAVPVLDLGAPSPHIALRYIRRDTSQLVTSDTREIWKGRYRFLTSISTLRLARSQDGVHFKVEPGAAIQPTTPLERFGTEDPRITLLNSEYYVNYTAVSDCGIATALAKTRDFTSFEKLGIIFCPENRDVTIFPEQIDGRFCALHRPVPAGIGQPAIWVAFSSNLREWGDHRYCIGPRPGMWDSIRIGGGAIPIHTRDGWLAIYHGVNADGHYALGAALLDHTKPWCILARSPEPLLKPEAPYEVHGFYGGVVFTCGALVHGDRMRIYYGAADTSVAIADFSLTAVLESLEYSPSTPSPYQ
ncbi:MAG: glycoside hydrolase family 130 protein [Chloroflexi bacterium]|nr:glycoside hydrolase family 130 protein [Chloroflexota bacterium]